MKKNGLIILFILFLFVISMRFWSFFPTNIDCDESVYLLVSRSILDGQFPYMEVWDHKPIGIYLLFLPAFIFKNPIFGVRLLGSIFVLIGAFYLFRIQFIFNKSYLSGLLAGIFYIFCVSHKKVLGVLGLASNTELFFVTFTIIGFYYFFRKDNFKYRFISGIFTGLAFIVKYTAIFNFLVILLISLSQSLMDIKKNLIKETIKIEAVNNVLLSLGFILPFLFVFIFFSLSPCFSEFFYANFTANLRYYGNFSLGKFFGNLRGAISYLVSGKEIILRYLILIVVVRLGIYFFLKDGKSKKYYLFYSLIWFLFVFLGIHYLSFSYHYFIQFFPPLCLILSDTITIRQQEKKLLIPLFVVLSFFILYSSYPTFKENYSWFKSMVGKMKYSSRNITDWYEDEIRVIANYILPNVKKGDYIYSFNYEPTIYLLTNTRVPTKYVLPGFILYEYGRYYSGADPQKELNLIFSRRPKFVIFDKDAHQGCLKDMEGHCKKYLKKYYFLAKVFYEHIEVYRLK